MRLVGVRSNRTAVGARARATTSGGREVHRFLSSGKGFGSTDGAGLHLGLGTDPALEELMIEWPSGITQRLLASEAGRRLEVIETGLRLLGDAAPGATVTLEACGPAAERVEVFVSLAPGWIPVPGLGVLELELPVLQRFIESLDVSGEAAFPSDIPSDPSHSGTTLCLEACVHSRAPEDQGMRTNRVDLAIR